MTFGQLIVHIVQTNAALCSAISDLPAPLSPEELKNMAGTDSKESLVAAIKKSFDCPSRYRAKRASPSGATRVRFGLPPDPDAERLWPYLYLDSYPPSLHPVRISDAMHLAHPMRPIPYEVTQEDTPPWLDRLSERPTVYVTMGTIFNRVRGVFAEILEGLANPTSTWPDTSRNPSCCHTSISSSATAAEAPCSPR